MIDITQELMPYLSLRVKLRLTSVFASTVSTVIESITPDRQKWATPVRSVAVGYHQDRVKALQSLSFKLEQIELKYGILGVFDWKPSFAAIVMEHDISPVNGPPTTMLLMAVYPASPLTDDTDPLFISSGNQSPPCVD